MKSIKEYINESLASAQPKDKAELQAIIADRIKSDGPECDLNDIDVSHVEDMSNLFADMKDFNGNISDWDVSKVKNMNNMFYGCEAFEGDVSAWDVRNVKSMANAFKNCPTQPDWYKG